MDGPSVLDAYYQQMLDIPVSIQEYRDQITLTASLIENEMSETHRRIFDLLERRGNSHMSLRMLQELELDTDDEDIVNLIGTVCSDVATAILGIIENKRDDFAALAGEVKRFEASIDPKFDADGQKEPEVVKKKGEEKAENGGAADPFDELEEQLEDPFTEYVSTYLFEKMTS